jgi:hypothetical protein
MQVILFAINKYKTIYNDINSEQHGTTIKKALSIMQGLLYSHNNFSFLFKSLPVYNFTNCLYITLSPLMTFIVYTPLTSDDTSSCTTLPDAFN